VLRFYSAPVEARGDGRVETVRVSDRNTGTRDIPAGLLVRSIGSRGAAIPGLPFDDATGIIPNTGGRISPGSYVVGWAKRGSSGGIGANRACAAETVGALFDDIVAGRLPVPGANTGKSSTGKSSTGKSSTGKPRSGKPGAGKPGTGKFARLTRSRSRSLARS
jgi:ferredoxin--NADP+ reductase